MKNANAQNFQAELKRNRMQSYVFLALLLVGAAATAYAFWQLHEARHELSDNYDLLQAQQKQIKNKNEELKQANTALLQMRSIQADNQALTQKQVLIKEIVELVDQSNTHIDVMSLTEMPIEKLESQLKTAKENVRKYDAERKAVVEKLFSSNESTRSTSRRTLLRNYSVDPKMISDILEIGKGKIDMKHKDSYYQVIYLLSQLDNDLLKPYADQLFAIFDQGEKAQLNGPSTKRDINKIRRRLK